MVFSTTREEVSERWSLVKGSAGTLDPGIRGLFSGLVLGEYGFTGLTEKLQEVRGMVGDGPLVVEKATLEDVVYFMGRTGEEGIRLHGRSN